MSLFKRKSAASGPRLAGDHSTGGAIIGGALKAAGLGNGVIRYVAAGRGNVNLSPSEAADLKTNGIPIAVVCEHEADWLLHTDTVPGRVQAASNIARSCRLPDGALWLACDFDATNWGPTSPGSLGDRNMQTVSRSLGIASNVIGRKNVAFYGSYFAIDWLVHHGWADIRYWQTAAWSQKQRHPAACLFQRAQSVNVHGVSVDVDEILKPDWGQRVAAPPPPKPKPPKRPSGVFNVEVSYDHDAQVVAVKPLKGKVKTWGDVNETIKLELDLAVGPKHGTGGWTGRVSGRKPR
jgi:hypothetical protein